ncbi:MAG: tRNA-dihydrouridine synthase family protein [Candidatus Paceibacterota bacterium]|jgi:nifR3 family TIM-barrel protein
MPNFWRKLKKPILALAPIAGYTNSSFRQICKRYGADVVYSEMASAVALNYGGKKTMELLRFQRPERPYVVQLFGNDPKYFRNAAKIVSEKIKPDGIDINMGCPAKKVFSNGSGAALMINKKIGRAVIEETLKGTKLPVSIKVRSKAGDVTAYQFVRSVKDLPIRAIMIHGRTLAQEFSGEIDYTQIKKIKSLVDIPVIANGGINTPLDAKIMLERTGADGIGIARGALMKPWLFLEIREYLKKGEYEDFGIEKIKKAALDHAKMSFRAGGAHGILEMRKYLLWYFRGFENAKEARRDLVQVESVKDIENVLKSI